jgi:acid phosphatase (class A)
MKSNFSLLSWLLCALLIAHPAFAKDDSKATRWLSKDQEQALSDTVPPPPAVDSAGDKMDYAQILAIQAARTPAMIAECIRYEKFSYKLFEDIYGKELTDDRAPKFHKLMKTVMDTTYVVNETAKNKYRRLRPYQEHPDTVHSVFTVGAYSYPSGHSMGSFTLAVVWEQFFPTSNKPSWIAQHKSPKAG